MEPTTLQMASVFEPFCLASRCAASRIGGFGPIGNHHGEGIRRDDGAAVAEFAAVIHLHGDARQPLDHELAGQAGVPAPFRRR